MNIVFMGTPDFAVPCLDVLNKNHNIIGVYTQPDRKSGRGKKVRCSPVKEYAVNNNLKVFQPENINKEEELFSLKPDMIVVVAYGQLLNEKILSYPKYGCINVHASILPKYRGAAPINFAIVNGEKKSGVTTMYMVKKLDAGDIIDIAEVDITENMTAGELHDILSIKGSELIIKTIADIEKGIINRTPQDDSFSTYASKLDKEMAKIDFNKNVKKVHNLIRGFNPFPVATTYLDGQLMKVYKTEIVDDSYEGKVGNFEITTEGFVVNCKKGRLLIKEIQMPNKKRMEVKAYLLGHKVIEKRLGE